MRLLIDGSRPRRWHPALRARLAARHSGAVDLVPAASAVAPPSGLALLFELERLVFGLARDSATTRLATADLPPAMPAAASPELTIDLSAGLDAPTVPGRHWRVTFDGAPGEDALLAALLAGRNPVAEIREGNRIVAAARLGTDYGGILRASFEDALARTATLILATLAAEDAGRAAPRLLPSDVPPPAPPLAPAVLAERIGRLLTLGLARRLYRLAFDSPHWRIGWRRIEGGSVWDHGGALPGGWRDLPDDGRRFYADPFAIEHAGRLWLFVEDFVHRLGKGLISAVEIGPDGPVGAPRPVLEWSCHLSYPFVFAREGEIWMVPETGGAGTIELFRATAFPGGWVREATLVSGVTASDATLVEQEDGTWWLFATVRDGGGAFSDALHLWWAPDFRGPWTPHPGNPVLIDIAAARPAGAMLRRGGALWRPVQDCGAGYGAALALARVDRLDREGFAQTVTAVLRPGPNWPGRRLHSLNAAGGHEFIDGSAAAPFRFRPRRA
ncbi:hypothetical protein GCM10011390_32100 [Aureimonas endophytica]|uniref:Glucosamine inositolphosphorylceramide transferase 1 N-terminal domain-containing protein n=1 Tax=Aureimonas endophytica TaxID=2027858 RepID=A0A916ZSD3_9HYPH|nr:hypothetical protein GCM10011390_32100 [Aureimonas endophytica]